MRKNVGNCWGNSNGADCSVCSIGAVLAGKGAHSHLTEWAAHSRARCARPASRANKAGRVRVCQQVTECKTGRRSGGGLSKASRRRKGWRQAPNECSTSRALLASPACILLNRVRLSSSAAIAVRRVRVGSADRTWRACAMGKRFGVGVEIVTVAQYESTRRGGNSHLSTLGVPVRPCVSLPAGQRRHTPPDE